MSNTNSNQPRLLVLTSTFPRWKQDTEPAFVFELCRRITPYFDITVLAPRSPGSRERETIEDLKVIRFPYFFKRWENLATHGGGILNRLRANRLNYLLVPFFFAGLFLATLRLLRNGRFDLIHAHWIIPQGLVAVVALALYRKKTPVICTSHGGDLFALQGVPFLRLKRWVINSCNALTVVSRAMLDTVLDMGVAQKHIKVISMGVDLGDSYTPDPTVLRSKHELLFVGRLVEKKGLHVLIAAMPKIIKENPDAFLTIAGSGPMERQSRNMVRQYGLGDKVNFLGMLPQSQLPLLYRRAAMAVFPFVVAEGGDQEGLGLVVIEAMGCGCPVISSDLPAIHDSITHKENGLLVKPGNPEPLSRAVTELLSNDDLRSRFSRQARKGVKERFDWKGVAESYSYLFNNLLNL